jgi:hypothetical protein
MSDNGLTRQSEYLQQFFGDVAEEIGRATGFVQRTSKLTGAVFLATLVLGWLEQPEATLNELVQYSALLEVEISEAGLQQRLNGHAVEFLRQMLAWSISHLRGQGGEQAAVLQHFQSVNVLDSSIVILPDALQRHFVGYRQAGQAAAVKVQLSFDYLTGFLNALELEDGCTPDQHCELPLRHALPDSLHLFDLGYFRLEVFRQLAEAGAFFVSRVGGHAALYASPDARQPLDLVVFLQRRPAQGDCSLYLGDAVRVPVRFLFQRVPPAVAAQRRRKALAAARAKGRTCSARKLTLLEWALFVTNVPADWLSLEQVLLVYRIRWQVELLFKVWKSQAKLARFRPWRPERVLAQLYARLLGLVLFQWLVAPWRFAAAGEVSLPKAFRLLQRYALRFCLALCQAGQPFLSLLQHLAADFQRYARKDRRRKTPSTYRRLLLAGA